jgi:hypothetical protein
MPTPTVQRSIPWPFTLSSRELGRDEDAVAAATDELEQHPSVEARSQQRPDRGAVLYGIVLIIVGLLIDPGASVWRPLSCSVVEGRNDVPSDEGQDGKHDDYDRGVLDRRVSGETG